MAQTVRIGILNDMVAEMPADGSPPSGDISGWITREVDVLRAAGRLPHAVEYVHACGLGLPAGTAEAVERAYAELAAAGVAMIVGPAIGDNALIATPLAEAARIPTLNWAGAERARGEWMFHLQVGSHEDESLVIARHLHALGCRRLAVAWDDSPIGSRHFEFLKEEADILGLAIVAEVMISPLCEEAGNAVARLVAEAPDGFVYLGLGLSAPAVARALTGTSWQGPRIMNTAGIRGYYQDFARIIEGWFYIDMVANGNHTLAALLADLGLPPRDGLSVAKGHDIGRLVAEGVARAPSLDPLGLKLGLERIKWLPAAEGHEGTTLGFGIQDRGALHGRYLVVRQWRDGETVQA